MTEFIIEKRFKFWLVIPDCIGLGAFSDVADKIRGILFIGPFRRRLAVGVILVVTSLVAWALNKSITVVLADLHRAATLSLVPHGAQGVTIYGSVVISAETGYGTNH